MNHIELIGIAGSGKSTVGMRFQDQNESIHSLTEMHRSVVSELLFPGELSRLGVRLPSKGVSYLARLTGLSDRGVNYCSLKYPEMLPQTAAYIDTYTDDPDRIEYITGAMLDFIEQFGIVEEHATDSQTLLIDEGFAFKAGAICHPPQSIRRLTPEDLRTYVSTLPVPDLIIFLRADPAVCVERMHQRKSGPPDSWTHLQADTYIDFAAEAETVIETVVDEFVSRGAKSMEVRTDKQSIDQSVFEMENRLANLNLD